MGWHRSTTGRAKESVGAAKGLANLSMRRRRKEEIKRVGLVVRE